MTRVLFLPDYGTSVGGGHVMRCLTLADALTRKGAECGFCVLPDARAVIGAFSGETVQIVTADWDAPIAVIDGYDYGVDHERALAAEGRRVAAIDDLCRAHDCDLVLDSGPGRTPSDYPGRARALTGLDYALIRPEFLAAPRAPQEGRVLVSLGLTDVGAITERVLVLMLQQDGWSAADVVLGPGAPSLEFVQDLAARDPRISLHVNSKDMAGLQARAQFAVGAAGGSLYERSVMGVAGVTVVLAENQLNAAQFMADRRAGLVVDARQTAFDDDFTAAFDLLAHNAVVRRAMGNRAAELVDGKGADRVAEAVLALAPR
jgi:UDP-2,4-diacetamido-2,4,6-trideoxy-beta-L-altropyranose hydrolase